jgi:hypothetical protein
MTEYEFLLTNCETDEMKQNVLRNQRNILLTQSDWTQLPDAALTDKEKESWSKYRQALRDLPTQFTDLTKLKFPKKP